MTPTETSPSFTYSRACTVGKLKPQTGYSVADVDWKRLRKLIERLPRSTRWFERIGSALVGASFTAFFTWVTMEVGSPATANWEGLFRPSTVLILSIAAFLVAGAFFYAETKTGDSEKVSLRLALEEMDTMEANCERIQNEATAG